MGASVQGVEQWQEALAVISADMADMRAVNKEAAEIVLPTARREVAFRSGRLRRSIRAGATKRAGVVRAGSRRVPYAGAYHFGHFNRPQGGFVRPNPFLYKALDKRGDQVIQAYERHVDRVLTANL